MAAKAALIQFDWDQARVVGVQVLEQTHPDEDVIATAHDLKAEVQDAHPGSRFAIVANERAERQRAGTRPKVVGLAAPVVLGNPWAAFRMAD